MRRGCEALALRTISSTNEGLDYTGAFMGLGLITGCPVAVMRTPSVMALRLPGVGPLGRPGKAMMTGPLQGLDAALRGLAGAWA